MKCPKCGAELEDDAFFCDKCGSVVSADTDAIDLFSASEEKDDESGSLDFKAGDTSGHKMKDYSAMTDAELVTAAKDDADAENAEMAAAAAGFYSNTGKSDAINNGMNSRATDAESAEMAAVAAGFYSNTGKSEAISNGMNSRSADAESPEVVAAAAGFYSSANKGKTTDANNSVVFDAKIDDDELSQISIDKVKEVTDIAPDLYHGKLDVPDEELEQEDESKYAADLVTGEIKVSEEEQAQENAPGISFYVAEYSEYPILGEFHEGLTLQEAFEAYQGIPQERLGGKRSIGFQLENGEDRGSMMQDTAQVISIEQAYYMATSAGQSFMGYKTGFTAGERLHAVVLDDTGLPKLPNITLRERLIRAVYRLDDRHIRAVYSEGVRRL